MLKSFIYIFLIFVFIALFNSHFSFNWDKNSRVFKRKLSIFQPKKTLKIDFCSFKLRIILVCALFKNKYINKKEMESVRSSGNLENEIQLLAQETKINSLKNDLFGLFALNFFSVLIQFFSIFYFEWICLTKPLST